MAILGVVGMASPANGQTPSCEPVSNLFCASDCESLDISLGWSAVDHYQCIQVFRNGDEIATLAGDAVAYVDVARPPGIQQYEVRATCQDGSQALASCTVNHCLPRPSSRLLITEIVDGNLEIGRPRWIEITNCDEEVLDLSHYSVGYFSDGDRNLGGAASLPLEGLLAPGASHVLEYDTPSQSRFQSVYSFPPDQFAGGRFIDGDDAVALFHGLARTDGNGNLLGGTLLDVYGRIGEDGTGQVWDYTDGFARRLPNATPTPDFSQGQWLFGSAGSLAGAGKNQSILLLRIFTFPEEHDCECRPVADFSCTSDCSTNDVFLEWTGADDYDFLELLRNGKRVALLTADTTTYTDQGVPPGLYEYDLRAHCINLFTASAFCRLVHCGIPFLRGDVDGDGILDGLQDGLYLFNFGFVPGSPDLPCLEASDADGDGVINTLLDGVFLLTCQFLPPSPCPPPPYPKCGFDPDPDNSLGCDQACF